MLAFLKISKAQSIIVSVMVAHFSFLPCSFSWHTIAIRSAVFSNVASQTAITSSAPRMGLFIFLVISFQVLLAGLYVGYKRRRAALPKKFL